MEDLFCNKHIIGLIWVSVYIAALFVIGHFAKKKISVRTILKIGALLLIAMEAVKLTYYFIDDGFSNWQHMFPIQFCSLMLYCYPVLAFSKGKLSEFIKPFAYVCGTMAGLLALILPTNILGDTTIGWLQKGNFYPLISFIYHGFMVFYSIFLLTSGFYRPKMKHILNNVIIGTVFAAIAQGLNVWWDRDYMMLNKGIGNPLLFILTDYGRIAYYAAHLVLMIVLSALLLGIGILVNKSRKLSAE